MFIPNHLHILVKGYIKNPPKETITLNDWFIRLVDKVSMKVVAGPTSVYVEEEGNEGLTGTVTLATSHASIHIWDNDKPPMFQFDLYSCSGYAPQIILDHLNEFDLIEYEYVFIDRNDGIKIIDTQKSK